MGTTSYVQPAKPPKPIFNKTSFVYDVYTGDLEDRDYILQFSEVSFVFYYAPWCHKSMLAAKEFAQIAKDMYHQVINVLFVKLLCHGFSQVRLLMLNTCTSCNFAKSLKDC